MWINARNEWHALFHHRSCSAPWVVQRGYGKVDCGGLAYSVDGVDWHYADIRGTGKVVLENLDGAAGWCSAFSSNHYYPHGSMVEAPC